MLNKTNNNILLVGKNVEINCSYNIPQNKQLGIIANNSIILKPGFVASGGSLFSAKIDPSICSNSYMAMAENTEEIIMDENFKETTFGISIFPNPNNGSFTIEFDSFSDFENYALKITTLQGQTIYSMDNISDMLTIINLTGQTNGVYILSFYHKETLETFHYKIVTF